MAPSLDRRELAAIFLGGAAGEKRTKLFADPIIRPARNALLASPGHQPPMSNHTDSVVPHNTGSVTERPPHGGSK